MMTSRSVQRLILSNCGRRTVQLPVTIAFICVLMISLALYLGLNTYTVTSVHPVKHFGFDSDLRAKLANMSWIANMPAGPGESFQFWDQDADDLLDHIEEYDDGQGPAESGRLPLRLDEIDMSDLKLFLPYVKRGGRIKAKKKRAKEIVAVIIPFRERESHLPVLLRQLLPVLRKRGDLHARVFVIEQGDLYPFNRGQLLNVGFREALRMYPFTCFVFHDVDLIPENARIPYGCERSPMHLSVAVDKFGYELPYRTIFGGVEMFRKKDFELVNGFPNSFFGWGGEDDNLYHRVRYKGLMLHRPRADIARYTMLLHEESPEEKEQIDTQDRLDRSLLDIHVDGLNNLNYRVLRIRNYDLYTHIRVHLVRNEQ